MSSSSCGHCSSRTAIGDSTGRSIRAPAGILDFIPASNFLQHQRHRRRTDERRRRSTNIPTWARSHVVPNPSRDRRRARARAQQNWYRLRTSVLNRPVWVTYVTQRQRSRRAGRSRRNPITIN
jgi:hypothetical protein